MSSSFGDEEISRVSNRPFGDDGYIGFDPNISSHSYGSYSAFASDENDNHPIQILADGVTSSGIHTGVGFVDDDSIPLSPEGYGYLSDWHLRINSTTSPFSMPDSNGSIYRDGVNGGAFISDGSILPPPRDMQLDEGVFLREWRRQNTILLEEKENVEKELRNQIISEAEEYKKAYHEKRNLTSETNRTHNREKEKVFLANLEKFHANADKQCWKAIAELIPSEVPNLEKRGKTEQEKKKPSVSVIQGPKPGNKPTDLSRMRQLILKLKTAEPKLKTPKEVLVI